MTKIIRTVDSGAVTEAAKTHIEPYNLIRIELVGGTLNLSDGKDTDFDSTTFVESSVMLGKFSWSGTGDQVGTITLMNSEDNLEVSLVLNNGVADAPVTVWSTFSDGPLDTDFTTPTKIMTGVCDSSEIRPERIVIKVLVGKAHVAFTPRT